MALLDSFADRFTGGGALPDNPWDQWLLGQQSVQNGSPLPWGIPGAPNPGGAPQAAPLAPPTGAGDPFAARFGQWESTATPSGRMQAWQPAQEEMPPAAVPTSGARPPGIPAVGGEGFPPGGGGPMPSGGLPFSIPGNSFLDNPIQAKLGENANTLFAFAGGAYRGGIGKGLENAAKAGLIEGPENQKIKAVRDQQLGIYQALRAKGMSHGDAMSAAMSPEIMKAMAPELYGAPKVVKIGQDIMGSDVMALQHPGGKFTPITMEGGAPGAPVTGHPTDASGQPLMGPDLLTHLEKTSPTGAAMVKAIIRGDASIQPRMLQKFMPLAEAVDPTLQQFNYDVRKKAAVDFAPGNKSANNVKALETVGGHIDKMMNAYNEMGNTWSPDYNSVKNWMTAKFGNKGATTFDTFATGVANELGTVFRSYGMSDSEVKSWRDRIASSASPDQFNGNMGALGDMLKTRRDVLAEQYRQTGKEMPPAMFKNLDTAISRIESMGRMPGPAGASQVTKTIGGKTYIQQGNQWFQQ